VVQNSEIGFLETFNQVRFINLANLDKGWNVKADPAFFA
jgi:hypothetical protein